MSEHVERICLRVEDWPADHREAWKRACRPAGFLEDGGKAAQWRQASRTMLEQGYGAWLNWLTHTGQLEALSAELVPSPDLISAYIEALTSHYAPLSIAVRVRAIGDFLRVTVEHEDVEWLIRLGHRMVNRCKRATPQTLVDARVLYDLGLRLMKDADSAGTGGRTSRDFRDGLMIAFLTVAPVRRRSLLSLHLDSTMVRDERHWTVRLGGEDTKNGRPLTISIPDDLTPWLDRYVEIHRTGLVAKGRSPHATAFWLGRRGQPMDTNTVSHRLTEVTLLHLGKRLSPHGFRHCVATSIADRDPVHVGIIKDVLGHASLTTGEQYYNRATSVSSLRRYQATLQALRR